ncbi:unnamed protein product [Linum trigynum]|uniref:Uncharacterized protein n=1 Tax=Linum trigynum TaxID=586398 RepID=A0AAV2FWU3_9ROSI
MENSNRRPAAVLCEGCCRRREVAVLCDGEGTDTTADREGTESSAWKKGRNRRLTEKGCCALRRLCDGEGTETTEKGRNRRHDDWLLSFVGNLSGRKTETTADGLGTTGRRRTRDGEGTTGQRTEKLGRQSEKSGRRTFALLARGIINRRKAMG